MNYLFSLKISFLQSISDLFYPKVCVLCKRILLNEENTICLNCMALIPRTNYHLWDENPVEKRFWGKVKIERATAFFYFVKDSDYRHLLHLLKYKGNTEIGIYLGYIAATDLATNHYFDDVDLLVPVPLHPDKYKKRGYNQSEIIAIGMEKVLNKPVETRSLIRIRANETQTNKSVFERYENTKQVFEVADPTIFCNKHVVLVDDVLTTGATLEACMRAMADIEGIRISVFVLAVA